MEEHPPISYQQPRGHGVKLNSDFFKPNKPYCRYIPEYLNITTKTDARYELIDLLFPGGFMSQIGNDKFFNSDGTIIGTHGEGANPPWLWTDWKDKKKQPEAHLFTDPANYILIDHKFESDFSTEYVYRPFLEVK